MLVISSGRSILLSLGVLLGPCIRNVEIVGAPRQVVKVVSSFVPSIVVLSVGFRQSTVDNRRKCR